MMKERRAIRKKEKVRILSSTDMPAAALQLQSAQHPYNACYGPDCQYLLLVRNSDLGTTGEWLPLSGAKHAVPP